jgi:hypothetical protein
MTCSIRPTLISTPALILAFLLVFPLIASSNGPGGGVIYIDYKTFTLHQMNPDGAGDTEIAVDLPKPQCPLWSRNGRLIALTSPLSPKGQTFYNTFNAFVFNPTTGAVQQVTHWPDTYPGCVEQCTEDCTQVYCKAFSGDDSRLAVVSMRSSVYWWVENGSWNSQYSWSYPIFEIYDLQGGNAKVVVGKGESGIMHQGDGLDWTPDDELLVCPWQMTEGAGFVTALVAVEPVEGALNSGRFRKLTVPQFVTYVGNHGVGVCYDQDFKPALGPLSKRVAYVRERDCVDGGYPVSPSTMSVRTVNLDGTDDREIYAVPPGKYITHLNWAPDESKLILSSATQVAVKGWPMPLIVTDSLHIDLMNQDGAEFRQISGPGDDYPSWNPFGLKILLKPAVLSISPVVVKAGDKGFNLTVNGKGFNGASATGNIEQTRADQSYSQASVVLWNGSALPTTFVSPTRLMAAVPSADIKTPGSVKISVLNPAPGGGVSPAATLIIEYK